MLPKLENKTQNGTILYIVLLIINCSTYVYNIYTYIYTHSVQQNKAYAYQTEHYAPIEITQCSRLAWYRTRIGRVQYSVNAFLTPFYFEKSY